MDELKRQQLDFFDRKEKWKVKDAAKRAARAATSSGAAAKSAATSSSAARQPAASAAHGRTRVRGGGAAVDVAGPEGGTVIPRRLQEIGYVHHVHRPTGFMVLKVLDALQKKAEPTHLEDFQKELNFPLVEYPTLRERLLNNVKVSVDDKGRLSYRAKFSVNNKVELLALLRAHPEGLPKDDVWDLYANVQADLADLCEQLDAFVLVHHTSRLPCYYPWAPGLDAPRVDGELKERWRDVSLPRDAGGLAAALRAAGLAAHVSADTTLEPMMSRPSRYRDGTAPRRRARKRYRITNVHMEQAAATSGVGGAGGGAGAGEAGGQLADVSGRAAEDPEAALGSRAGRSSLH